MNHLTFTETSIKKKIRFPTFLKILLTDSISSHRYVKFADLLFFSFLLVCIAIEKKPFFLQVKHIMFISEVESSPHRFYKQLYQNRRQKMKTKTRPDTVHLRYTTSQAFK